MEIKDYLHLYLGCECMIGDLKWKPMKHLHGLAPGVDPNYGRPIRTKLDAHVLNVFSHQTTLILRKLSDMTEEDQVELGKIALPECDDAKSIFVLSMESKGRNSEGTSIMDNYTPEMMKWLLSKSFDLFGLIDAGLAIDITTLKH